MTKSPHPNSPSLIRVYDVTALVETAALLPGPNSGASGIRSTKVSDLHTILDL